MGGCKERPHLAMPKSSNNSLTISGLAIRRGRQNFGPISLTLSEGSWLSVVGESGAGKSTLLNLIAGLVRPTSGTVSFSDRELTAVQAEDRPCTLCLQEPSLFPVYSVLDNIAFPLRAIGWVKGDARKHASESASKWLIPEELLPEATSTLSGGEARRVAICRSLMRPAKVVLLDEVTNGLDQFTQSQIINLLHEEHAHSKAIYIFVTHDPSLALRTSSRAAQYAPDSSVAVMRDGRIIDCGSAKRIYRQPQTVYAAKLMGNVSILQGMSPATVEEVYHTASPDDVSSVSFKVVGVRHHDAVFSPNSGIGDCSATVLSVAFEGPSTSITADTPYGLVDGIAASGCVPQIGDQGSLMFKNLMLLKADEGSAL